MYNNIIRCKKLATIVSGWKYVARPFVKRKQVKTSAEIYQQRTKLNTVALYLVLYVAVTFRHSCSHVVAWRRVVLHFIDPDQLLQVFASYGVIIQSDFQSIFITVHCWLRCLALFFNNTIDKISNDYHIEILIYIIFFKKVG